MKKDDVPAYAVLRSARHQLRVPNSEEDFQALIQGTIKVVRVLWSFEEAVAESNRLNKLQAEKGLYYYCQHTHVVTNSESY